MSSSSKNKDELNPPRGSRYNTSSKSKSTDRRPRAASSLSAKQNCKRDSSTKTNLNKSRSVKKTPKKNTTNNTTNISAFNLEDDTKPKSINLAEIKMKKISDETCIDIEEIEKTLGIENIKYFNLDDNIESMFWAMNNYRRIFDSFEEVIKNREQFKYNPITHDIKCKNQEGLKKLQDQKFWILFIQFLVHRNKLHDSELLIKIVNRAFNFLTDNYAMLLTVYIEKMIILGPIFDEKNRLLLYDNLYYSLLDDNALNVIYGSSKGKYLSKPKFNE